MCSIRFRLIPFTILFAPVLLCLSLWAAAVDEYFAIEVVDEETGRGVPLVELITVNGIRFVTDSAGRVAFHEPGLMNEGVYFFVESHGYEHPADGFGYRGFHATTTPGETRRVALRRTNLAERLYRLSGTGIYRDTVLLGMEPPIAEPLLNAKVLGQDSVVATVYSGKIYWFWGDTQRPGHPLGNFNASGATSPLPSPGGTDPERGIDYSYFTAETGFAKEMAPMPGDGPTWLSGLSVVRDADGRERMVAGYSKIKNQLDAYIRGLAVFNDERQVFEQVAEFSVAEAPLFPMGHALRVSDEGDDYLYFSWSLPLVRAPAAFEELKHFDRYKGFTPLVEGSRFEERKVERDASGAVVWGWKAGTPIVGPQEQATLIEEGLLSAEEALFAPRDIESGESILLHAGAAEWNPFRERWVLIASELFGTSVLGEVWFLEADSPLGPWVYARKIVTHDNYTFYNPKHHRFLDEEGGRLIYFEGTYTKMFSAAQQATPRYDYNQILYRLDLGAPELALPVAIYRQPAGSERCLRSARQGARGTARPEFWAMEQAAEGMVAVWCRQPGEAACDLAAAPPEPNPAQPPLFFALAADSAALPPGTIPLENANGEVLGFVWEHPMPKGPKLAIHPE